MPVPADHRKGIGRIHGRPTRKMMTTEIAEKRMTITGTITRIDGGVL
jgi:hypothetical protein